MKKLFFVIFSVIYLASNAQDYAIIDSVNLYCNYLYNFQQDSLNPQSLESQEMILQIGSKYSKFTSKNKLYKDSLVALYQDEPPTVAFAKVWPLVQGAKINRLCNFDVFKNYPRNGTTVFISDLNSKHFKVEESEPINWNICTDRDTVLLGYTCQMAKTFFAGREYEAWFTNDIPISDGPYKFNGLPGLIILVSDIEGQHIFRLTGIHKSKQPIFYPERDSYINLTPLEFAKAYSNSESELINKIQREEGISFFNEESKARALRNARSRNNFIEKY